MCLCGLEYRTRINDFRCTKYRRSTLRFLQINLIHYICPTYSFIALLHLKLNHSLNSIVRCFVHLSYLGTNYNGWQRQPRHPSVQQTIEEAFEALLKRKVFCLGCGRTDAGVHAAQFFFLFDYKAELPSQFVFKINKMLPDDIAIHGVFPVEGTPHAQFSAVERTYEYYIHTVSNPYLSAISTLYHLENPDLKSMQAAANLLLLYQDYSRFCKCPLRVDNVFCQVKSAQLFANDSRNRLLFRITADRFIAAMNRVIVHRLLEVATGKLSLSDFEAILSGSVVPKSIRLAYPQGLHLVKATYPFLNLPSMSIPESGQNEYFWNKIE